MIRHRVIESSSHHQSSLICKSVTCDVSNVSAVDPVHPLLLSSTVLVTISELVCATKELKGHCSSTCGILRRMGFRITLRRHILNMKRCARVSLTRTSPIVFRHTGNTTLQSHSERGWWSTICGKGPMGSLLGRTTIVTSRRRPRWMRATFTEPAAW